MLREWARTPRQSSQCFPRCHCQPWASHLAYLRAPSSSSHCPSLFIFLDCREIQQLKLTPDLEKGRDRRQETLVLLPLVSQEGPRRLLVGQMWE